MHVLVAFSLVILAVGVNSVHAQSPPYPQIILENALTPENTQTEDFPNGLVSSPSFFMSHGMFVKIKKDPTLPLLPSINVDIKVTHHDNNGNESVYEFPSSLVFDNVDGTSEYVLPFTYVYFADETDDTIPAIKAYPGDTVEISYQGTSVQATLLDDDFTIYGTADGIPDPNLDRQPFFAFPFCGDNEKDADGICRDTKIVNATSFGAKGVRIAFGDGVVFWKCNDFEYLNKCPTLGGKDVYLELDYFMGHKPDDSALKNVVDAFANHGITLHIDVDDEIPYHSVSMSPPSPGGMMDLSNGALPDFDKLKGTFFGTHEERQEAKDKYPNDPDLEDAMIRDTLTARRTFVHYAIFGHSLFDNSSGMGERPGNDFVVTLGKWEGGTGNSDQQAGTLMHELGHNFGLDHGGGDSTNCKPNYLSVMSYSRQFSSLFPETRPLDYSDESLLSSIVGQPGYLDKSSLDEFIGVTSVQHNTPMQFVYGDANGVPRLTDTGFWTGPPVLLWLPFEDTDTSTISDVSGNDNSVSMMYGSTNYADVGERPGKAFAFDGSNPIQIDDESVLDFEYDDSFSVSFWIKPETGVSDDDVFLSKGTTTISNGWIFNYDTNTQNTMFRMRADGSHNMQSSTNSIPLNEWTHVVLVYDNNTYQFYINGQPDVSGSESITTTIQNDLIPLIGAQHGGARAFDGQMDDVQFWNYALSSEDVQELYGGKYVSGFQVFQPVSWNMDNTFEKTLNANYINLIPDAQCTGDGIMLSGFNDWNNLQIDMWKNPTESLNDGLKVLGE